MNLAKRTERNRKLIEYLTTPTVKKDGKLIYPTLWDAALKFGLSLFHVQRIKRVMIGLDKDWKKVKENE